MESYIDKIVPQVGGAWRADEIYVKVRGDLKYVFVMLDDETRYLIAHEVADRKEGHDASALLQKSKQVTQTKPKVFITDGLGSYAEAYQKEFWTVKRETGILHIKHIHLQKDYNNNKMERWNGKLRDREKVMRGLKKTDTPILKGFEIFHNYLRPHSTLNGMTPSEKCGITINGDNKWITLIQNASKSNYGF
jgi:transposase-like protein